MHFLSRPPLHTLSLCQQRMLTMDILDGKELQDFHKQEWESGDQNIWNCCWWYHRYPRYRLSLCTSCMTCATPNEWAYFPLNNDLRNLLYMAKYAIQLSCLSRKYIYTMLKIEQWRKTDPDSTHSSFHWGQYMEGKQDTKHYMKQKATNSNFCGCIKPLCRNNWDSDCFFLWLFSKLNKLQTATTCVEVGLACKTIYTLSAFLVYLGMARTCAAGS